MNRRQALAGLACGAAGTGFFPIAAAAQSSNLLDRAMVAAGGAERLAAVRRIAWQGRARIHAGERIIDIVVDSWAEPFGAARSDSWLAGETRASMRSLILDRDGAGWIERGGGREAMPPTMALHERQQYGLYALMLLAPIRAHGARVTDHADTLLIDGLHPMPPTTLAFDRSARLVGAANRVASSEGGGEIAQSIGLYDHRITAGISWPMALSIWQDSRPYFDLFFDSVRFEP